ncbi:MAG: radical SAM protein [Treponema sp.]|jgi:radical SAM superfamily enzyme YgiQ (UPF0313 family)|nr:radical SAM protein [Treponema sp.]
MLIDSKNLSVVFVSCHIEEGPEAVPLGAASVAANLKKHFADSISIHLVETFLTPVSASKNIVDGLLQKLSKYHADVIGFSMYSWNREIMTGAAAAIKAKHKDCFLFCGGPEVTALPKGLSLSEGGPFDSVICGEGELAAQNIISTYLNHQTPLPFFPNTNIPVEEMTTLPSPWLENILNAKERGGVLWELARGCPYACTYCYESKGAKNLRYFPDERILAELDYFAAAKPSSVFVLDPTFNTNKERAKKILQAIIKKAPKIHWHFEVRGELLTKEQARLFSELNTSLQIGLQSSNPKVCALSGRTFNPDVLASKISLLHEAGVSFGLDLIYGLPGDSLDGYKKSLDFALALYPDNLDMFKLSVLPGTIMYDQAETQGLTATQEPPYQLISGKTFSEKDLYEAEKLSRAADLFYNRGRSVAWFMQMLYPLGKKPSKFLESFADFLRKQKIDIASINPAEFKDSFHIEKLQLSFLDTCYTTAKKDYLLPLVWDIVRFHAAWGRALAEGISTEIICHYHPDEIFNSGTMDIEEMAEDLEPFNCKVFVKTLPEGPEYSVNKK